MNRNKRRTNNKHKKSNCTIIFEIVTMVFWVTYLLKSDAYYMPYLILGAAGFVCFMFNKSKEVKLQGKKDEIITRCYGILFSMMVALANYNLYLNQEMTGYAGDFFKWIYLICSAYLVFVGGYYIFFQILLSLYYFAKCAIGQKEGVLKKECKIKDWQLFLAVWGIIVVFNAGVMFLAQYPGVLTPDSINQITQLLNGTYSNHHPYYHTQIIHIMMALGYRLFGNINAAVATFSMFSIIMMAFCFAYVVYTIFQWSNNLKMALIVFIWYFVMPFHIIYSFTIWKDVLFGASVTFFVTGLFRVLKKVGSNIWINYMVMLVAALGMCLLRSNGWFALLLSISVFGAIFWNKHRKVLFMLGGIVFISFVLKHPVLDALHVPQPDRIESLSIPAQQIARVVADGKELTPEQEELLGQIVDIEAIPEAYNEHLSDPIKKLVRASGNQNYINENGIEFIKLYLQLGITYSQEDLKAWVDQTKGYWNGGYNYWRWVTYVQENSLGIERVVRSGLMKQALEEYLWLYADLPILQIFLCIGFHIWLIIFSTYFTWIKKDYIALFIAIPILMVDLSLLVATPLYTEFRYIYTVFCSVPFILCVSFGSIFQGIGRKNNNKI